MGKARLGIIKYGRLSQWTQKLPLGAGEVFPAKSGRFVVDNSGVLDAPATGANELIGGIEFIGTAKDTDGKDKIAVNTSHEVWYELPIYKATAMTQAVLDAYVTGKNACNIYVSNDIQYADLTNSTNDYLFQIMGGSVADQTVYVKLAGTDKDSLTGVV